MRNKNHATYKLEKHDFFIDSAYIRRRETNYLVNKMAVPAWVSFSRWAINKGLRPRLRESLSSDSKYVMVMIHEFRLQKKAKQHIYIVRFSDHPWIDKGVFDKPDFEVGLSASTMADIIAEIDKIADTFKPKIEWAPKEHRCELVKKQFLNEHRSLRFYVYCPVCNQRSEYCRQEHIAKRSWDNGERFALDISCTTLDNKSQ